MLESNQDTLEKYLGSSSGEVDKARGLFFHQKLYGDFISKSNWEDKINWLLKMQDLYVSTLGDIF